MFFPYSTDAPVYYWPFTTVAMIAVSVVVFFALLGSPETAASLSLAHGDGLHPLQWVTSNFVHGGFAHLLGNMLCLWSFGLIVEGKLGWHKTLTVFLGIGILQCAIEQFFMQGASAGCSFGSSAIIFGFMAMSLIWAPENEMQCVILFGFWPITFEMRVYTLVGLLVALEVGIMLLNAAAGIPSALHVMGAAMGFAVAIVMLKAGLVDCENWDLFSIWAGRHKMTPEERQEAEAKTRSHRRQQDAKRQARCDGALAEIREIIQRGHLLQALRAHQHMAQVLPEWTLPEADLLGLIKALHEQKLWAESIPLMVEYLAQHPHKATLMRLKLAQILVAHEKRPAQAISVLAKIDESALDARGREFLEKLRAKAEQVRGLVPVEMASEDW